MQSKKKKNVFAIFFFFFFFFFFLKFILVCHFHDYTILCGYRVYVMNSKEKDSINFFF